MNLHFDEVFGIISRSLSFSVKTIATFECMTSALGAIKALRTYTEVRVTIWPICITVSDDTITAEYPERVISM